jgi:hypothetical protein
MQISTRRDVCLFERVYGASGSLTPSEVDGYVYRKAVSAALGDPIAQYLIERPREPFPRQHRILVQQCQPRADRSDVQFDGGILIL